MNTPITIPMAELIPVGSVSVVNPRVRNQKVFREIVSNIAAIGLKRPITVARRAEKDGLRYELVCGQGRLEAFQALGQSTIPAIVIDADDENCMIMSLVENLARRQHQSKELLSDIGGLKQRGYTPGEIAKKTDLTIEYVRGVIRLIETGEDRLLKAVETKQIPLSVAVEIASVDDAEIQQVLQQAYDQKLLRGNRLTKAKRLIEQRRRRGKKIRAEDGTRRRPMSVDAVMKKYREDTQKKRALVRKADMTRGRLIFIVEALRKILADDHFKTLLKAEGLDSLPRNLSGRLHAELGG
jgi:ParB family transcriptional regulator, chromosome partitioning protein